MEPTTMITCPRCAAPAGDPCVTAGGNIARTTHVVRTRPVEDEAPAPVENEDVAYSTNLTTDHNEEVFLWDLRRNGTLIGKFARHAHAWRVIDALREGEPELVDLPLNEMVELLVHDLRFDHYEIIATPRPVAHTPTDSLAYIGRAVNGLLDLANDTIHGVYTDNPVEPDELPEHLADAVAMLETAVRTIRYEAAAQGAYAYARYSNGVPTTSTREEPTTYPGEDEFMTTVVYDLYPDGQPGHPLSRHRSVEEVGQ